MPTPKPKLQPGDEGFDWNTYSSAAKDDPINDAKAYLAQAPDLSGVASIEDRLAALHRPEHGMARQITDFGEQIAGPAALASLVPTPVSPFAGGAAATLYGLSGLRKALMPEADESRIGGAIEAGLSALPMAGRAFKALRGAKAIVPELATAAEEVNPLAGMQAGEGSNANLLMDPGHTTEELTEQLAHAKSAGEKDFLNRTLTQRQVVLRKLKDAATAPPDHYQSTEPLGPKRYESKGQEVPYRMGSGHVDIQPRKAPAYPENLTAPKPSSSGYKSANGGVKVEDTVGAKLSERDYSQELSRASKSRPTSNATSVFDKMAGEGTFGPEQQGFTNRQYDVDLSGDTLKLPEGHSYEDVFGPNPSDLELKKLARLSWR